MEMSYKKATESNIEYDEFDIQVKHIGIQRCVYATVGGTEYFIFIDGSRIKGMDLTDNSITTLATITASVSMGAPMLYLESGEPRVHWFRSESISPTSFDVYEGTAAYDAGTDTWSGLGTNTFLYNLSTEPTHYFIVGTDFYFMTNSTIYDNTGLVVAIDDNEAVFNVLGPEAQDCLVYWDTSGILIIQKGSWMGRDINLPQPTTYRFENQFFYMFDDLQIAVTNEYIKFKHPDSYIWKDLATATTKLYQSAPIWNKDTLEPTYVTFNNVIYKITTTSPVPIQALANGSQGGIVGGIEDAFFNIPIGLSSTDFFNQYEISLTNVLAHGGANPQIQTARMEGLRGTLLLPERPELTQFLDCSDSGGNSVYLAKILNVENLDDNAYLCATTSALNLDLERGVDQRFYHKSTRFILKTLIRQTCFYIHYTESNITNVDDITLDLTNISLADALARIEVKTGLWASLDAQGNLYLNNTGQDKGALSLDSLALTTYPTRSYLGMQAQACIVYGARNPYGGLYYGIYQREVGQGVLEVYSPDLTSNADCEDYAEDLITTQEVEIIVLKRARFIGNYIDDYFPGSKVSLTMPFFDYTAETFYVTNLEYQNAQLTTTLTLTSAIIRYYKNRSLNEINYLATSEVNLGTDLIHGLFPAAHNFGGLERGYYPAYESFWNVEDEGIPIRWDADIRAGGYVYTELGLLDGHKNNLASERGKIYDLFTPPTSTFTIAFWWRTDTNAGSYYSFASLLDRVDLYIYDTSIYYRLWSFGPVYVIQTYNLDQWYHIRVDFDDTAETFDIFVDDVEVISSAAYTAPAGNQLLEFGVINGGGKFYFDGIDFSWADGYYDGRNRLMPAGGAGDAEIVAELDGHAKVLRLQSSDTLSSNYNVDFDASESIGGMEFWLNIHSITSNTPSLYWAETPGASDYVYLMRFTSNVVRVYEDGVQGNIGTYTDDVWHHYRIVWDLSGGAGNNIYQIYQDGILIKEITTYGFANGDAVGRTLFTRGHPDAVFDIYVDAIDFSWAPDYYVGRNNPTLYKWLRGELS